ncbi:MAG: hypothetical protein CO186_09450 [Zetaproteobacteria bacterium CG_4_9_14_3_um_filter_49_83]|nr:MAG: hypothetical protein AUJ56_12920 [Zetaproteobacteria bacterium CG1_02_49_23]PIQ30904.1 MAG: hypothetical protein COW62_11035 [Zetaproteobacteria bacterium CG17_big_fil_post_rev_8_21_14_2_50_50_13]PIV30831.1 MAG: hypothetical protein COS35_04465 [Zetaproteobacteria bacterium CG02_land_8_20_14_3_00_50_9]PIY56223.1 MAG: hypothetical protein COZ00_05300 [Zetaproteobacteria bacterium CG_4_10_14_0_8_um_filter_49_80]PJA34706.1 MAG: hypothetical protein CO186_09450 [Zetaproteobacteria bacterium
MKSAGVVVFKFAWVFGFLPSLAFADPLDKGEAYTERQEPPDWMDGIDFTWLIVDYGLFALAVIGLGWLLLKRAAWFTAFERVLFSPFRFLLRLASRLPVIARELLQGITGLLVLLLIVAWVFLCQWLSHHELGAIAMAGLALEAVILVRLIKGTERARPVLPE